MGIPVSKVLILDESPEFAESIKTFCADNFLVGLTVRKSLVMSVLRKNIDLGGVLFSDTYGGSPGETARIALTIHALRPELPIFLRRQSRASLDDLPAHLRHVFCAAYVAGEMAVLRDVIHRYIFCMIYPNSLVRGMSNLSETVFEGQFPGMSIRRETPCIVHDRIIFGEVFSLIPLESTWCRGYMMLQTEEEPLLEVLGCGGPPGNPANVRMVNDRLGEIANMVWGSFKNKYIGDAAGGFSKVQVPLVVNHRHRYISFGTENPHLCFIYHLSDPSNGRTLKFYERFVFNLSWSPQDFREVGRDVTALVDSGEIELL